LVQGAALVTDPSTRRAYRLFHTSNFFLAIVLLAICVSTLLGVPWPTL
jgi:hypothetical protein